MTAVLESLVIDFCRKNDIKTIPLINDQYEFYLGSIHTKFFEYGESVIFLSMLETGLDAYDQESFQSAIKQFAEKNSIYMSSIDDTIVYDERTASVFVQRIVNIDQLNTINFEEHLFSHMENIDLLRR